MKLFVTGSSGLLGSALVPLLQDEHTVEEIDITDGPIWDSGMVGARLDAFRPDVVVHLAAMTHVDGCESDADGAFRANAEGSRVVAAEAERVGAAVLALSTDYVFDGEQNTPYREEDTPHPLSIYGRSKLGGEEAVRQASTQWTLVRSAWLFGPGGGNFVDTMLRLLRETDTPIPVVEDQRGSPTLITDLVAGLVRLIENRSRGLFHLVNSGSASWYELARETARLSGFPEDRILPATTAEIGRPAPRPRYSVLGSEKVVREQKIRLRPWKDALKACLEIRAGMETTDRDSGPTEEA